MASWNLLPVLPTALATNIGTEIRMEVPYMPLLARHVVLLFVAGSLKHVVCQVGP